MSADPCFAVLEAGTRRRDQMGLTQPHDRKVKHWTLTGVGVSRRSGLALPTVAECSLQYRLKAGYC